MNEVFPSELLPGTSLFDGKYIIEKKIGSGGFGITYLAKHSTLEKLYAIKEFFINGFNIRNNKSNHVDLSGIEVKSFEKLRQRFFDEARTMAKLNHDAVVKVLDIFNENGTSYMVMPFIQGITLQNMVEKNGPFEYELAVNYIVQICEALSYIHSKGILHRDVTPDNVIVKPDQKIVLIDFGSARKFTNDMTQRHTAIVKQGFAPMEQYSATSHKGAYTDLYSLGAVFYYILTGKRPMDATERVNSKIKEPIELNPEIPEQINAVIMKAMEMDSQSRYQSADEMIHDIMSGEYPQIHNKERTDSKTSLSAKDGKSQKEKNEQKKNHLTDSKPKNTAQGDISSDANNNLQGDLPGKSRRNLLKIAAIALAALAIIMVIYVLGQQKHRSGTIQSKETYDTLYVNFNDLNVLMSLDCNSIMEELYKDPNNPIALFAIAQKADHDTVSVLVLDYWNNVLNDGRIVPKDTVVTGTKIALVCAVTAYENVDSYQFSDDADRVSLLDTLTHFINRIDPTILKHEIQ